jgi:hypothetical protein
MMSRVAELAPEQVKIGQRVKSRIADGLVEFVPA